MAKTAKQRETRPAMKNLSDCRALLVDDAKANLEPASA